MKGEYLLLSQTLNGQRILEEGPKREKKRKIDGEEEKKEKEMER